MEYSFFSWYFEHEEAESDHQLKRKSPAKIVQENPNVPLEEQLENIRAELNQQTESEFWKRLTVTPPSYTIEFLNFHFEKFKERNPASELDFLYLIDEQTDGVNMLTEKRRSLIKEWIETKKKKLETEPVHPPIKKIPRLNEYNKPILNQVQISILFRVMKDMNIISNRDLTKKTYSEIIHTLFGYSPNKIRANLSAPELIEISERPQDYLDIINNLYRIIERLERAKNEIPVMEK